MQASDFLKEEQSTMAERGKEYDVQQGNKGEGDRSMGKTIVAFNAITGLNLSTSHGWLLMLVLKQVRQSSSPSYHHDSAMDSVAYAALLAESLNNEYDDTVVEAFDIPIGCTMVGDDVVDTAALANVLKDHPDLFLKKTEEAKDPAEYKGNDFSNMGNAMRDRIYEGKGDAK